jgi:hypothetical protein
MRILLIAVFLSMSLVSSALSAALLQDLPVDITVQTRQTHIVRLRTLARPTFTYIRDNEAFSDFATQVVLIKDRDTGDIVSVIRQNDKRFVDHDVYLPAKYLDQNNKFHLVLVGSSPWTAMPGPENPIEVVSASPIADADYFQNYEIVFGKPDDIYFLGENISYAEGAYPMTGTWFHNKFFRSTNDPASFYLPLANNSTGYLVFNLYFSEKARVTINGRELAVFDKTLGSRFYQDFYRTRYAFNANRPALIQVENVAPFRTVPTNLRQLAFGLNSVEVARARTGPREKIDLIRSMNERLDYRQRDHAIDRLLSPVNPVEELLHYQGGAWLPSRAPIPGVGRRQTDAVVLLDPVLQDLANVSYSSGDIWLDAAVGAAMMLENLGFSVAYAFPDQLADLKPKIIYIPSQPFYTSVFSEPSIDRMLKLPSHIIIEPSFAETLLDNEQFANRFKFKFLETASMIGRDDVLIDGHAVEGFAPASVFGHAATDNRYASNISLLKGGLPVIFNSKIDGVSVSMLTFSAGYYFYNYGLRAQQAVIASAISFGGETPFVRALSKSKVRAYAVSRDKCRNEIMVENDNRGSFNYYGFGKARSPPLSPTPPVISELTLDGGLFKKPRGWTVFSDPPFPVTFDENGRPHLHHVTGDTVVHLSDRRCAQ